MPKDDDETTALKAELSNIAAQIREHQEKARLDKNNFFSERDFGRNLQSYINPLHLHFINNDKNILVFLCKNDYFQIVVSL